jgi:Arc/MetJ-type ribon-helix-helix transcriptional regulator
MSILNITLPDELVAYVDALVAEEGYVSRSDLFRTLLREERKRRARRELEARFREAIESGPDRPMTRDDWDALRREALEGLATEDIRP